MYNTLILFVNNAILRELRAAQKEDHGKQYEDGMQRIATAVSDALKAAREANG